MTSKKHTWTPNVMSTFRFKLDTNVSNGLKHLAQGKEVNQKLIEEAYRIVESEIRATSEEHGFLLSKKGNIWFTDVYFRKAIKLKTSQSESVFADTVDKNNVTVKDLTDKDVTDLAHHLKGSIFESEINDELKNRKN